VWQHNDGKVGFVENLFLFLAVNEFQISVKKWQLSPWVWCTTFWDKVYLQGNINSSIHTPYSTVYFWI